MRLPVTIVLVALALGCAPMGQGKARVQSRADGRLPAATVEVDPADRGALLLLAAAVLEERGLRVASRERDRIVSVPRELDVPCGASTCLARELVVVRVADGRARVEILRGLWEPAARHWVMALAPAAAEDAAAQEAGILSAIVASTGPARPAAPAISLAPR